MSAAPRSPPGLTPATSPTPDAADLPNSIAERRLVSILFADLVGSTTLSATRDSEEVRDLLSRYFETSKQIIGRYGGTIEKFIGDAVMAVWGAPTVPEDDAERARAGLALAAAVTALGRSSGSRASRRGRRPPHRRGRGHARAPRARAWWPATLSIRPRRIQSVAPPGAVFVGEATMHAAATRPSPTRPRASQFLHGKEAPVPALASLGGWSAEVGGAPPFGRASNRHSSGADDELRMLKDLFHTTSHDQRPHLVLVIGPAGIGK